MKTAEERHAEYATGGDRADTLDDTERDPLALFGRWLKDARDAGIKEPNAMVLATVSAAASPSSSPLSPSSSPSSAASSPASPSSPSPSQRNVLLKSFNADGFVFFTNHGSRKARELQVNAAASALFAWLALHRQVIVEGEVARAGEDESRDYFHARPRQAQLGAWASRQSEVLASRQALEARMAAVTDRFADTEVPLPPFWGGYRLRPQRIEFWQGRHHRLHDRIVYTRADDDGWRITRLYP